MSSDQQPRWRTSLFYDVFVSFCGRDTRAGFTSHLIDALLRKSIMTFVDVGDETTVILDVIQQSRIAIVVLSENYAYSTSCLDELVEIMKRRESMNLTVFPLFYNLNPSDVRHRKGRYGQAMAEHKKKFGTDSEKVQEWELALCEIGGISGWVFQNGQGRDTSRFIHEITQHITNLVLEYLGKYDVFISFRGLDTGYGFTGNLQNALRQKKINIFFENDERMKENRKDQISPLFVKAINESRISIVVLSENYASSPWCLEELNNIIECMETKKQLVWPIFYKVDPSHVRRQTAHVGDAMADHEKWFGKDSTKVLKWRSSLSEVANLTGWPFQTGRYEYEIIQRVEELVVQSLSRYDVFLSFSAEDAHYSLGGYLNNVVQQAGFKTFTDNDGLDDGNQVSQQVIENSRHSLIILSENYAYSSSCLDDLVKIIGCMKRGHHVIWPIFYNVDPLDVQNQTGSYGDAIIVHEKKFGKNSPEVQKWKKALSEIIYLGGYWREYRSKQTTYTEIEHESELIKEIVEHLHLDPRRTPSKDLKPGPKTGGFKITLQHKSGKESFS